MIIQLATINLWSSITGTRLGVLLPQKAATPASNSSLGKRKRDLAFQSDLPKYISFKKQKCDVLCAIIEFRNLKGRSDGTKFFIPACSMHGDYQGAYCPITQIFSLAFRDEAFLNTTLTPELIWRLRKQEKLNLPLLRRVEDPDELGHYNYRRWTANEANRNFISQERKKVLGQSGDGVFERYYQSEFVQRDLQHVVLLRPSQEGLLRDPLAPSDLTSEQRRAIRQHPEILELRRERELYEEMRSLANTVQNARESYPPLYQRHTLIAKESRINPCKTPTLHRKSHLSNDIAAQLIFFYLVLWKDDQLLEDIRTPLLRCRFLSEIDSIACSILSCNTKMHNRIGHARRFHKFYCKIHESHANIRWGCEYRVSILAYNW
ncbi:Protein of unknown function (DUF3435) domain containing protein [Elaphomyces granulatus]